MSSQVYVQLGSFFEGISKSLRRLPQLEIQLIDTEPLLKHLDVHLQEVLSTYCNIIVKMVHELTTQEERIMKDYELQLRSLEEKLRRHVKIEIQLKIYYEFLENKLKELQDHNLELLTTRFQRSANQDTHQMQRRSSNPTFESVKISKTKHPDTQENGKDLKHRKGHKHTSRKSLLSALRVERSGSVTQVYQQVRHRQPQSSQKSSRRSVRKAKGQPRLFHGFMSVPPKRRSPK